MDHLPELDPFSPESQRDPIAAIDATREQTPLARSARGLEVLTYEACVEIYNNEDFMAGNYSHGSSTE